MVMPDPSYTAIQLMVIGTLSRKYGWEFYEKLRKNEIMIVQSHRQVSETLTRGERLIAAEGADFYSWPEPTPLGPTSSRRRATCRSRRSS